MPSSSLSPIISFEAAVHYGPSNPLNIPKEGPRFTMVQLPFHYDSTQTVFEPYVFEINLIPLFNSGQMSCLQSIYYSFAADFSTSNLPNQYTIQFNLSGSNQDIFGSWLSGNTNDYVLPIVTNTAVITVTIQPGSNPPSVQGSPHELVKLILLNYQYRNI